MNVKYRGSGAISSPPSGAGGRGQIFSLISPSIPISCIDFDHPSSFCSAVSPAPYLHRLVPRTSRSKPWVKTMSLKSDPRDEKFYSNSSGGKGYKSFSILSDNPSYKKIAKNSNKRSQIRASILWGGMKPFE